MTIVAAADGSALGNPGPAGWAWYVDDDCWASGGWPHGTNNMGELMAVLDLLRQTAHVDDELVIFCDSRYVIDSITKWMPGWKRNGWVKKDKKPVLNVELMKGLDEAMAGRRVRFEWVKGHSGHPLNEAADQRANAAAAAFQAGGEADAGPGFAGGVSLPAPEKEQSEPDLFSAFDDAPSAAETVIALERSLLTDEVRADRAAVAALLHADWTEFGTSGRVLTREETLDRIGPIEPTELEVIDVRELAPGVILLLWRASSDTGTRLRSSVWTEVRGQWQQLFHQGTREA